MKRLLIAAVLASLLLTGCTGGGFIPEKLFLLYRSLNPGNKRIEEDSKMIDNLT